MALTPRGSYGKLVAYGTRVVRVAHPHLQAASILSRRGLCYPPSFGLKRVPDIRAGQWGRIFVPTTNTGSLVWRQTMKHSICQVTVEQTENPNTKQRFISFYQGSAKINLTIDQIPSFLKVVDQFARDHSAHNICGEVSRLFEGEKR